MTENKKEKILVIKLGALGDFVQALGPMKAIRKHHPDAEITLLTTAPFMGFAEKCGYFNNAVVDPRPKFYQVRNWLHLLLFFQKSGFTRVYDLQNNDRTGIYFLLFGKKHRPEWVGIAKGASHCNTSLLRTAGHAFEGHKQTLALAGITDIEVDTLDWIQEDVTALNVSEPYVLLVAGCAPQHPQKRWPPQHYGQVAQYLRQKDYQVVLLGTKTEAEINAQIKTICPDAIDLTGKTSLSQIVVLGRGAACTIGNDTGPMHMIAPTGSPCIVLFSGHSDPKRHAPKGNRVEVIQKDPLPALGKQDVIERFEALVSAQP